MPKFVLKCGFMDYMGGGSLERHHTEKCDRHIGMKWVGLLVATCLLLCAMVIGVRMTGPYSCNGCHCCMRMLIVLVALLAAGMIGGLLRLWRQKVLDNRRRSVLREVALAEECPCSEEVRPSCPTDRDCEPGISEMRELWRQLLEQAIDLSFSCRSNPQRYYERMERFFTRQHKTAAGIPYIDLLIRRLLDSVEPGIIDFIRQQVPALSESEVTLFCMICQQMSKTNCCMVLGWTQKNYYNRRNELRKKLGMTNERITFPEYFAEQRSRYRRQKEACEADASESADGAGPEAAP